MKKVTLSVTGMQSDECIAKLGHALNALSGIVAADVSLYDQQAVVHAGDQLENNVIVNAITQTGYDATILQEDYL